MVRGSITLQRPITWLADCICFRSYLCMINISIGYTVVWLDEHSGGCHHFISSTLSCCVQYLNKFWMTLAILLCFVKRYIQVVCFFENMFAKCYSYRHLVRSEE